MNYNIPFLPERSNKPRQKGLTMMMDKGLSVRETENFVSSSSEFTDLVKFGFGTSLITKNLNEKIKIYKDAGIIPYFGGTLFELFIARGMFDDYRKYIEKYNLELAEVSDGAIALNHDLKCEYIQKLSSQVTVISEVGSKDASVEISPEQWNQMMKKELQAGSWKVIAEARESGNLGIYNSDGSSNKKLIDTILHSVNKDDVIWEAPQKSQQVWFIKLLGAEVNLGNIAPNEVISLETIRLGLRGDTVLSFLPEDIRKNF
ncbi:MAG TPA: phosphosulfolactate synthase [Bacteroidales bacterium]|nr:MAG: phosphosulfolactate synthase [Bacteroidetes bacterium GWF2_33_38]OFY70758.1 MAG: phosphosulfolactate synthase [Bacteroidetes bacterium RIFOXYA12_FULL_33_9]OFY85960.1 MAG: phosphosulfolactate synthase [Bacteroidetes bacterium RIFOXYA2_FULL_33_7]HBF88758.1 phosphosulfolactate synthase [Bacteroidales bacterium]